ncbi:MAG: hypothetical protein RJA70_3938 [Pseudomonadota bacterium]|jgi:uncharacterized protein
MPRTEPPQEDLRATAGLLATELGLAASQVRVALQLLADGGTVPFIARYRKEATGGLDEVQILTIEERFEVLKRVEARRATILSAIAAEGKLTETLHTALLAARSLSTLEDLYLPYKKKRRTRASVAREQGLEPLAKRIAQQPLDADPQREAARFVDPSLDVTDVAAALQGARDIVAEWVAERADARALARRYFARGSLVAQATANAKKQPTKFEQYYGFEQPIASLPSHRYLAICRGEAEGMLRAKCRVDEPRLVGELQRLVHLNPRSPFGDLLSEAVTDACKRILGPSVENETRAELKEQADRTAAGVFADNLKNLLLAPPLGEKPVFGIDPGIRTGCKLAVLDQTGKFVESFTLMLSRSEREKQEAANKLAELLERHQPSAIGVGNGTGGRETETWLRQQLKPLDRAAPLLVSVSEAGASVYSASAIARSEFPDLDLTIRGAISIGRRLQDPLAELVKLEPKAIGVGQYQHDIAPALLDSKLADVVASCVNRVGVSLNTASSPLLSYVSGLGPQLAARVVAHRDSHGPFRSRNELKKVKGLGPKTFEQCAGFLRIADAAHPLDASAVHPERYQLVERMARDAGVTLQQLLLDPSKLAEIRLETYVDTQPEPTLGSVGLPTLQDIVAELKRPGRDPREDFQAVQFRDDVNTLDDLTEGMTLDGVVTNVTAFGAFVDVGVHQDGLVHVSQLAERFVKDPSEVVQVGQRVKARVLAVDRVRRRVSLSLRPS